MYFVSVIFKDYKSLEEYTEERYEDYRVETLLEMDEDGLVSDKE